MQLRGLAIFLEDRKYSKNGPGDNEKTQKSLFNIVFDGSIYI